MLAESENMQNTAFCMQNAPQSYARLLRWQGMVLMRNAPLSINLPESHGQSKFKFLALAVLTPAYAVSDGSSKSDIGT